MNAEELRSVILSEDFGVGLEEVSDYLASIVQERPIVNLLARCLWNRRPKYSYALERYQKHDLTVNGKHIEFKFNYDSCTAILEKELARVANSIAGKAARRSKGNWGVIDRIWKDLKYKSPHMFVWVICARDLSAVSKTELERICWSKQNLKYRRSVPYGAHRAKLRVIDGVLKLVQQFRPFMVVEAEIETSGLFPSTYHFRVCEFQDV